MTYRLPARVPNGLIVLDTKLVWEGAQKSGMTTRDLAALIHRDKIAASELMWV